MKYIFLCFAFPVLSWSVDPISLCGSEEASEEFFQNIISRDLLPPCELEREESLNFYLKSEIDQNFTQVYPKSGAVKRTPVLVLFPDWKIPFNHSALLKLSETFLKYNSASILSIDWSDFAYCDYFAATSHLSTVISRQIAEYLCELDDEEHIEAMDMIFIGHGVGAHLAGIANWEMEKLCADRAPLIVAADAAGFGFSHRPKEERLHRESAERIIQIVTAADSYGTVDFSIGDQTFVFNCDGKAVQPGCEEAEEVGKCSHFCALDFLRKSFEDEANMKTVKCENYEDFIEGLCRDNEYQVFGLKSNESLTGRFYMENFQCEDLSV